jgi:hypothetical protein
VAAELDLNLFPFHRIQGQELPQLPGLLAIAPPRRCEHGREDDYLLVYLTLSGTATFSTADYNQFITQTSQRFYQTPGSLTFAMRTAAGELNQSLLNRNLHTPAKGKYILGRLIMGVLRGSQFFFAQCGPTHVFHLTGNQPRQFHDEQIAGHGLGVGQATPLYFSQVDLHPNDLLVLCPSLPTGWDITLLGERNFSYETVRRTLLSTPAVDLNAILVQALPGKGKLTILKGLRPGAEKPAPSVPVAVPSLTASPTASPTASLAQALPAGAQTAVAASDAPVTPSDSPPAAPAIPTSRVESEVPGNRFARLITDGARPVPDSLPDAAVPPVSARPTSAPAGQPERARHSVPVPVRAPARSARRTGRFVAPRNLSNLPEIKRPPSRQRRELFGGLARAIHGLRTGTQRMFQAIGKFLPALTPNPDNDAEVGRSSMALFAIVVPVIIVALAATVYIHYGRSAQYTQNYDMALAQAAQARGQTSPADVRRAWDSTIYYLDLADKNLKTSDSATLRTEAQTALDNLDGILRLDFRPAIVVPLDPSVHVTHMAATDTDLYLLDASHGNVIHATSNGQSFEKDINFKCDPGIYGTVTVGALVDLQVLQQTNFYNATIMAMDAKGNMLYCGDIDPLAVSLDPPQLGWRNISAFSLSADGKNLYVLDPAANAVWQYTGSSGQFQDLPVMFFGDQVPQNMNTAIDLAANDSELYMLFQDGHVTTCPLTHYAVVPLRCADPSTFVDTRPERQPGPRINDAIFTQMSFATAPDPSLYMLEPLTRAIYRFSPRPDSLELRGQFRATMQENNALFGGPATAMTISSNRDLFFSTGNQVYFATDVP